MVPDTSHADVNVLVRTIQDLSRAVDIEAIQAIVKTAARRLAHADGATVVLREGSECHYVDEDAIAPLWKGKRFAMADCISGWVMLHRTPTAIEDIYQDDRIPQDAYRPTFVRSLAMMPIRTLEPIGAIGVYWSGAHQCTPYELGLLAALADSTSVAITNVTGQGTRDARVGRPPAEELVHVCAWTNRVEVDGQWVSFVEYLKQRFGLTVTHGISDEAYRMAAPSDIPETS